MTLNVSVSEEHCILSDERQETATWWVNLTRISSIHHITTYYMTGTTEWGMSFIHILDLCLSTRFYFNWLGEDDRFVLYVYLIQQCSTVYECKQFNVMQNIFKENDM